MLPPPNPRRLAIVLAILVAGTLAVLGSLRTPIGQVIADEGTYLAMIDSLRDDGDLQLHGSRPPAHRSPKASAAARK